MAARFVCSRVHRSSLYWRKQSSHVLKRSVVVRSGWKAPDKVTHTGQSWEDSDYRNVRFIDKTKEVNERFAIDLLKEEPVVLVEGSHTWCDGERGALGHPKIFINLDKPECGVCGYCGKRFLAKKHQQLFQDEHFATL